MRYPQATVYVILSTFMYLAEGESTLTQVYSPVPKECPGKKPTQPTARVVQIMNTNMCLL